MTELTTPKGIQKQTVDGQPEPNSQLTSENDILFDYQKSAVEWLKNKKVALLSLDMGLGKTAVTIRALDEIGAKKILVLCPAVAANNWKVEFQRFSNRADFEYQLLVFSYGSAHKIDPLESWDVLVCDESQYLKNFGANRTHEVLGKNGLVRKAGRFWALSGTPAPNHAGELWPLLFTFGATKLSYDEFIERFCNYRDFQFNPFAPKRRQITGTKLEAIPELQKIMAPFILRRLKKDVLSELPPLTYEHVVVDPCPVRLDEEPSFIQFCLPVDRREELFKRLEREAKLLEEIMATIPNMREVGEEGWEEPLLSILGPIAKSVATLRRYTGAQKVEAVAELVKGELLSGQYEKVVIFAIHEIVIENLRERLTKFGAVTLYGRTPDKKRIANIESFQNEKRTRVFIGNILAAGTAITLTAAHNVIFAEQDWVPGNNAQAAMRCHRIGQKKHVHVRFISLANSIDERIVEILRRKTREFTKIFDERNVMARVSERPEKKILEELEKIL